MTPESVERLEKARILVKEAHGNLELGYKSQAGRIAYLAAFNAAQTYIFECTGKLFKTHNGVHDQFYLLVKDDQRFDAKIRQFMARTYRLKAVADYETGPSADVPLETVQEALATAERFVAVITDIIQSR